MTGHGGTADDDSQGYEIELGAGQGPPRADGGEDRAAGRRPSRRWWFAGGAVGLLLVGGIVANTLGDDDDAPAPPTALATPTASPAAPSAPAAPTSPGEESPGDDAPGDAEQPPLELDVDEVVLPPDALRTEPSPGWSLDAADLTDQVGRAPSAAQGQPYAGSVDLALQPADGTSSAGATVVALVGAATDRAMVVGVDARTGDVRWRLPEPGARACQYISGGHAVFCGLGTPAPDTAVVLTVTAGEELGRWAGLDCLPLRASGTPAELVVAGRTADDSPCLARGGIGAAGPEVGLTYSPEDGKDPLDSYRVYEHELTVREDTVLFWAPPVVLSTATALTGFSGVAPNASGYLHPSDGPVTTSPLAPHATRVGFNDTVTTLPGGTELDGSPWTQLDGTERSPVIGVGDTAFDATGRELWSWDPTAGADAIVETYLSPEVAVRLTFTTSLDTWLYDISAVGVGPESGDELWRVDLASSALAPMLAVDGVLLWVDQMNIGTGNVAAQDAVTGEWLWNDELEATAQSANFTAAEVQVVGDVVVRSFADHLTSMAF